jgi:hypothetical protein
MFFVVDPDTEVSPQQSAEVWQHLWAMRNFARVSAMLPAAVSSPCPLLPDEAAGGVLMASLTAIPSDSAWVPVELNLCSYTGDDGRVRLSLLDAALCAAVAKGEQGHDATRWSSASQHHDSALNRRLAIFVRGWGDVVARRGLDPESLATLREMQQLANHVATVLAAASRAMAERHGYCPALDVAGARILQHGSEMHARWRRAVGENAVRHRNLLTLSPWDVFPRREPADIRYTNLLPLLKCANSVSFRRDVDIDPWNVKEFKGFHERISAILRHSSGLPAIAKQV